MNYKCQVELVSLPWGGEHSLGLRMKVVRGEKEYNCHRDLRIEHLENDSLFDLIFEDMKSELKKVIKEDI